MKSFVINSLMAVSLTTVAASPAAESSRSLRAALQWTDGNPKLVINGQPFLPHLFYGGYKLRGADQANSVFAPQIELARDAGVQLLSSEVQTPWERNGRTDFTVVDRIIRTMIETNPEAYVYLRFSIDSPPWWNSENPEECTVYADGTLGSGSLTSPVWREAMLRNIRRLVEHCEKEFGDRIAVYQVCGLEYGEWIYPGVWENKLRGFDPQTRKAFMDWAVERYGSWKELRLAWNSPELSESTLEVPSAEERRQALRGDFCDPSVQRRVIDYRIFENDLAADTLLEAAGAVQQVTDRQKPVAAFYGYLFEVGALPGGPTASGHYALERVLRSPEVDILASPISYGDRSHDGISAFMSPVDSVTAHGKLWVVEDDSRTWLCPDDSWPAVYGKVDTPDKSVWVHRRNWGHIVPRRIGLWHMDLVDDGWFNSPLLWENIKDLRAVYEETAKDPKTFSPEIAVFIDPESAFYLAANHKISGPLFSVFRSQIYRIGAPVGFYLLNDLIEGRVPSAKVNLILNAWNLNEQRRAGLHQALRGKTAVWFHGAGWMNERRTGEDSMRELTGLEFKTGRGTASVRLSSALAPEGARTFQTLQWHTDHDRYTTKAVERNMILDPRWSVRPRSGTQELAAYTDSGEPAIARTQYRGFESIYSGTLGLPSDVLRTLCRQAGVHLYLDSDDVVSADHRFLSVSASSAGEKEIRLPSAAMMTDRISGERFHAEPGKPIRIFLKEGESRLFRLEPAGDRIPGDVAF